VVNGVGGIWWWWWWNEFCLGGFLFFFFSFCGGLVALALATHPIKMKISSYAGALWFIFVCFWRRFSILSF